MRNCLPDSSWQWGWTPKRQRVGHLSTSWLKCDLLCKKKIKTKTKHWLRNKEKGEKQLRSSGLGYSPVKGHSSILALTEPMYDYCYKLQEHQQEIKKKKKKSFHPPCNPQKNQWCQPAQSASPQDTRHAIRMPEVKLSLGLHCLTRHVPWHKRSNVLVAHITYHW